MKNTIQLRSVILGALLASLVFVLAGSTLAALEARTIDAYTGVKVYLDDRLLDPRDVNGDPVETIAINGTTYLPIRAVATALGLPVQYDPETQSAYLGRHESQAPAVFLDELAYFSGTQKLHMVAAAKDNLGGDHARCIYGGFERAYKLNGQYSRLSATLFHCYDFRSLAIPSGSGLWLYADDRLVYVKEFSEDTSAFQPEQVDVDLTGVQELRFLFMSHHANGKFPLYLGDAALYT